MPHSNDEDPLPMLVVQLTGRRSTSRQTLRNCRESWGAYGSSIYNGKEMDSILTTCAHLGAKVMIDTSFSGLEFDHEGSVGWYLASTLSKLDLLDDSFFCVSLRGGSFLNILSRALKFGCLIFNNPHLIDTFYSFPGISKPHSTVRYAIKKLMCPKEQKSGLTDAIAEETSVLKHRYERLKETLEKCG